MEGAANVINAVVDSLFLADMIIIFNSSFINEDTYLFEEDRCKIVSAYLSGWFWIDLVAIIPFNWFTP